MGYRGNQEKEGAQPHRFERGGDDGESSRLLYDKHFISTQSADYYTLRALCGQKMFCLLDKNPRGSVHLLLLRF